MARAIKDNFLALLVLQTLCLAGVPVLAQDATVWDGEWIAEGTLFRIAVSVDDNVMDVQQIESLGFVWTSDKGVVDGDTVRVKVEYAGVNGVIQAELIDANTAVAFAASCMPEFMVVCALAKNRQAVFRKVGEPAP